MEVGDVTSAFSELLGVKVGGITVEKLISVALLVAVCLIMIKIIMALVDRSLNHINLEERIKKFLRGGIRILLLFLMVLIVMGTLDIQVTSLVALLSVVGLALSLAIQNMLSNVAGGLQMLSTKPFVVGDFIEAGGVSGTVSETGMFYTKLRTIDNKAIQIPNSQISAEKIVNYSAEEKRRVDLKISASYEAPIEQVKAALLRVLGEHPKTLATPAPMARVIHYGENAIEYAVRVWCANEDYWDVYFDVMEGIKEAFDREGIEMTYNHLNVHMIQPKNGCPNDK